MIKEPWYSAVSGCMGCGCLPQAPLSRGLIRKSNPEIGFDPSVAVESAVFLIDRIPKVLVFSRFRIADCVRLPNRLFPRTDSGIGR
ncbi:hypothetical protein [Bifidobacterium thermophilum]|uniref:hypothetical protein n=1 Tax=Bifidobacterium thermophilum TaxID=33905 RepID=UPI003F91B6A5